MRELTEAKIAYTTCYMCACKCGIKVTIEDGKLRFIQGNQDSPVNQGVFCAKGAAGIMTEYSPARLRKPLLRVAEAERGEGRFVEVEWETALDLAAGWLGEVRERDPRKLAFYTGRDQMQTFTGFWSRMFGTPNWASHGGFCSVNMAAGGVYSVGGSLWEFGFPDLDHASLFLLIGVAEDHPANPLKLAISRLRERGGRFVVVNPVRSGYGAIADQWIPIRPGTDGFFLLSLMHVLVREGLYAADYLADYTNAPHLVAVRPGCEGDGLFFRRDGDAVVFDRAAGRVVPAGEADQPALEGEYDVDGEVLRPAFALLRERLAEYSPERAAEVTGIPARTIRELALEMGDTALRRPLVLPIPWRDAQGMEHPQTIGRPVAIHAMRGLAAHSNGFQTVRALFDLMMLLGTVDVPGGFLYKPPYPKAAPPPVKPSRETPEPGKPLGGSLLGYVAGPEDLLVDDEGRPQRLDEAYSWDYPLAAHGMIQNVIRNAWRGQPYKIDVLMVYMANLAWNSMWNTGEVQEMLRAKDESGAYRIPKVITFDAFHSEMVAWSDLVFPDTTYLERYDAMSLLDRPISEPSGPADCIRHPVLPPPEGVRSTADVLIDLGVRLRLPRFVDGDGGPVYASFKDFITNWETEPGSGVGLLAGFRGAEGREQLTGSPNPDQVEAYVGNRAFWHYELPDGMRYYRMANRDYLDWSKRAKFSSGEPVVLQLYSEPLQRFRLAGQGLYGGWRPPEAARERLSGYFDPLPFWYSPLEWASASPEEFPLVAITQRPMCHYHSWGSHNAWLRQLLAENVLYVNPRTGTAAGLEDGGWAWLESRLGRIKVPVRYSEAVEPGTVWTWNGLGKAPGAWGLSPDAAEARRGFLLNHIIPDLLPDQRFNSDPITGQAAWFDLRVRLSPAEGGRVEAGLSPIVPLPGRETMAILAYSAAGGGKGGAGA